MTKTLPRNSSPQKNHLSFRWWTAVSDSLLVKRASFGSLINEIVRLVQKFVGGDFCGENASCSL
jgi:hypothetical protein